LVTVAHSHIVSRTAVLVRNAVHDFDGAAGRKRRDNGASRRRNNLIDNLAFVINLHVEGIIMIIV
jgi:hypothetical protein